VNEDDTRLRLTASDVSQPHAQVANQVLAPGRKCTTDSRNVLRKSAPEIGYNGFGESADGVILHANARIPPTRE